MSNLALVKSEMFGNAQCDLYKNNQNDLFMTMGQLAKALGYTNRNGIEKILSRNEYLKHSEFSTTDKLSVVEGNRRVVRDIILFTEDGIYEVAFKSDAPKAQEFRSWVRKVIKDLRQEIHAQNVTRENGTQFQSSDIFEKIFGPKFRPENLNPQPAPKPNLAIALDLFVKSYTRLYPETLNSCFQYLWKEYTGTELKHVSLVPLAYPPYPSAPLNPRVTENPAPVAPAAPMKLSKLKTVATNAVADKALELIKAFVRNHSRSFDPRYGIKTKEYILIRNSVFNDILTKDCPRQAVLRNLASRGLVKSEPCGRNDEYRRYAFRRWDRHHEKHSFYIMIKADVFKNR